MAEVPTGSPANPTQVSTAPLPTAASRVVPTMNEDIGEPCEDAVETPEIAQQSLTAVSGGPPAPAPHRVSVLDFDALDDDDEFVAVDHEDLEDYSWTYQSPQPRPYVPSPLEELHPFVQLLSLANVDDCLKVEESFPEDERCSREKVRFSQWGRHRRGFPQKIPQKIVKCRAVAVSRLAGIIFSDKLQIIYRLTKCPELSLGVFSLPEMVAGQPKPRATLVAHVLATRTTSPVVTLATMGMPADWREKGTLPNGTEDEPIGHQDQGSTIAVHSLAVLSEHHGKGVGTTLMKAYLQRIKDAEIAERIALLSHQDLLPFYTSLGFENLGVSEVKFGSRPWFSLVSSP
jgi:GNAT superfamily N-acetyltransferase